MNQEKEDRDTAINCLRISDSYLHDWVKTGEEEYREWFIETMEEYRQLRLTGVANPTWVNGQFPLEHIMDGDTFYNVLLLAYDCKRVKG